MKRKEYSVEFSFNMIHLIGIIPTVLFAYILYKERVTGTDDGWFVYSKEQITFDTTISLQRQTPAIKKLKENDLIDIKRIGMPGIVHYRINHDKYNSLLYT